MSDGARWVGLLDRAEDMVLPLEVSLELTRRCNFHCHHCYVSGRGDPAELGTAPLVDLLAELADMGTMFVSFTGGEPLMRRDWLDVVEAARGLGFSLRVLSNGSLVDDDAADALADLDTEVEISLYSADAAVFDTIVDRAGAFAETMAGIRRLHSRGILRCLKTPVMGSNLASIDSVFRLARELGVEVVADPRVFTRDDGDRAPLEHAVQQSALAGFYTRPDTPFLDPAEHRSLPHDDGPLCAAGVRHAHVTAIGDVLACSMLPRPAGNLHRAGFAEIWRESPWLAALRSVRRSHLEGCADCKRLAYCKRCHGQALLEDGNLVGPASWSCEHAHGLEQAFAAD